MPNSRLTARDLTRAIDALPKNQTFEYIDQKNTGRIQIVDIQQENFRIKRANPQKLESLANAETESISSKMLWRIANAFAPGQPINFDRVLAGSYNTRSVLESLLAHTPEFYVCHPKRVEVTNSSSEIKAGHKHLVWRPDQPHEPNRIVEMPTEITISEVPGDLVVYDALDIPSNLLTGALDINVARRHAQM